MATRHGVSRKNKHVQLRFLYLQDLISAGVCRVTKIPTKENPADIFTKYVNKDILLHHLPAVGLLDQVNPDTGTLVATVYIGDDYFGSTTPCSLSRATLAHAATSTFLHSIPTAATRAP